MLQRVLELPLLHAQNITQSSDKEMGVSGYVGIKGNQSRRGTPDQDGRGNIRHVRAGFGELLGGVEQDIEGYSPDPIWSIRRTAGNGNGDGTTISGCWSLESHRSISASCGINAAVRTKSS